MESFAEYILAEKDLDSKMEIAFYLSKKRDVFFDKSVILKTELARLFISYAKIDVDVNRVLTACLLCNCKKIDNAQDLKSIRSYAKEGSNYLATLGFDSKFCKMCEEINRYSNSNPREKESDILELVDHFGGMLIDRPERVGFKPDEALVLVEHRNLKGAYNRYLETFRDFVKFMESIQISGMVNVTALRKLVKMYIETDDVMKLIWKIVNDFEPKIDKLMEAKKKELAKEMFGDGKNINRPLFSVETAKKFMGNTDKQQEDTQ